MLIEILSSIFSMLDLLVWQFYKWLSLVINNLWCIPVLDKLIIYVAYLVSQDICNRSLMYILVHELLEMLDNRTKLITYNKETYLPIKIISKKAYLVKKKYNSPRKLSHNFMLLFSKLLHRPLSFK